LIQNQGWTIKGDSPSGFACEPCTVIASLISEHTTCGLENGRLTVITTGGNLYTYAWSNGATTETIDLLKEGTYSVTVTAGNGCTSVGMTVIESSELMSLELNFTYPYLTVMTVGGKEPINFLWNTGDTMATIEPMTDGYYFVTITDADSCQVIDSIALLFTSTKEISSFVRLYPNPSNGEIKLEGEFDGVSDGLFEIYNHLGQRVIHEGIYRGRVERWFRLEGPGVYYFIVSDIEGVKDKGIFMVRK
jgi:hypothetical protein